MTGQITPDQPDSFVRQHDHLGGEGEAVYLDFSTYPPQYPCSQTGKVRTRSVDSEWKIAGHEGSMDMISGTKSS